MLIIFNKNRAFNYLANLHLQYTCFVFLGNTIDNNIEKLATFFVIQIFKCHLNE